MSQAENPTTTELLDRLESTDFEQADSACHQLLSSKRRRVTLRVLATGNQPFELRELARVVARQESNAREPTAEKIQRVEITLHHNHLPRMDEYGVIAYDSTADRIVIQR